MRLSADEVTVPIDWGLFTEDRGRCSGCSEQLDPPSREFPHDTKPHTVLDCLKTLARRAEMTEARRDG